MDFYNLSPSDIFVFYDVIVIFPGKFKVKTGGGGAGHNGIRSLIAHIGEDFHRVRLGVGHPGHRDLVHNFVLSNFSKTDGDWVEPILQAAAKAAPRLIEGDIARFQTDVALELTPPKEESQE
jgi:PTH1 family peptidyl-tRNA hydrolase